MDSGSTWIEGGSVGVTDNDRHSYNGRWLNSEGRPYERAQIPYLQEHRKGVNKTSGK